jgi:hypothetical protein
MPHQDSPRRLSRRWTAWLAAAGFTFGLAASVSAQTPNPVLVRAFDYAFQAPDTISAGLTMISLQNDGALRHELVLARLKPGHTIAELAAAKTPAERQALQDGLIGLILAEPGQRAMGSLVADLVTGRTYILLCTLRDAPDKPPHFAQGMVTIVQVR